MPRWVPGFLLSVLVCGVYGREPFNGFIWDDPAYVVDNPTLQSPDGLWDIWTSPRATPQYYPAVFTSFWIESRFWGTDDATGYHIDNVLLHALAAVLLWRTLAALRTPWPWLAAAVFAVHPVMVESVAWVTERKNVLSIVFYLLAFGAYVRTGLPGLIVRPDTTTDRPGMKTKSPGGKQVPADPALRTRSRRRWYLLALVLFLAALFSKTVTCSLPAAILLVIWWKRGRITLADIRPLIPFFAIGLVMAAVTSHLERTSVGATGRDFDWMTPADRLLIAGRAAVFYAGKIVWPADLLFMYPRWAIDPHRMIQWVYPAAVAALVAALWFLRHRLGRGPLTAILFFLGTLVPALGFFNVYPMRYSFVADHFQYLASIGLMVLVAAGLDRAVRLVPESLRRKLSAAAAVVILAPLCLLTWRQQAIYKDPQTLWRDTIDRNPGSWMAHINLAAELRAQGHTDEALAETMTALGIAPDEADPHYDLGNALARRGEWDAATGQFRVAVKLSPNVPACWSSLSRILWEHGRTPADRAEAVADADRAVSLDELMADAQGVLSDAAAAKGDTAGAVEHARMAALAEQKNPATHLRYANALARANHIDQAIDEYKWAVGLDPGNAAAWTNLGYCFARAGRPADAGAAFQRALRINPDFAPARQGFQQSGG